MTESYNERLYRCRMAKGLTQKELGALVGVTRYSITSYESGSKYPALDVAIKICNTLDFSLDNLVFKERRKSGHKHAE